MGHDHIRFVLMVAFFFSTCLIASSGSEMEIIRFSGTYTLTHSERVVQVTESITGSERVEKVTKVASLAPEQERSRRGVPKRRRTTKEFEMRQKSSSSSFSQEEEKQQQTFIPAALAMTQGTTTDQQDLCWSHAHSHHSGRFIGNAGGQCSSSSSSNHESSQEFTATYSDSGPTSSFLVCQKVSFLQLNLSEWTIEGKGRKRRRKEDVVHDAKQQQHRHERPNIPFHDDHHDDRPYKPIFFVYPPQRPTRLGRKKKVVVRNDDDDGMDYYQPTFHLDFGLASSRGGGGSSSSGSSTKEIDSVSIFSEYDPRIKGGFDSYGEDVSFYFSSKSSKSAGVVGSTGKEKGSSSGLANASSYYDELCKALLLEYG